MQLGKLHCASMCVLFYFLFSASVFAVSTKTYSIKPSSRLWHPILTISGGGVFDLNSDQSNNFPANDKVFSFYNYFANRVNQTQSIWGILAGAEFALYPKWSIQIGLSYYKPADFNIKGVVTQEEDTASDNQYAYKYTIQSQQLLVEGKLLYQYQYYHPYLAAGVGTAWNNSKNFVVNTQPSFTRSRFSNQFDRNTNTPFSYEVGFGLDVDVTKYARLGFGYRFTDFGVSATGNGIINNVVTDYSLSRSHLYANELIAQLTVILM